MSVSDEVFAMSALQVEPPLPEAGSSAGEAFPLILACRGGGGSSEDAARWVASQRERIEAVVERCGAIWFRGLPLRSAGDFDRFVAAFGFENFSYDESLSNAVRVEVTERVFTANEAPPTATIRLHHEMAQTPVHPRHLLFFCERPAPSGGATSLCRSDRLFEALAERRPDFVRACETRGLRYTHVMPARDDLESGLGRSWRGTFGVGDRAGAEERMRRLGYRWEWRSDGSLRATTPPLPAVRTLCDGRKSFFNQLIAALAWQDRRNDPSKTVTFGDGSPIDRDDAALAAELAEGLCVDLVWRAGDAALVDNHRVMHGRRSFAGTRRVLASLAAA